MPVELCPVCEGEGSPSNPAMCTPENFCVWCAGTGRMEKYIDIEAYRCLKCGKLPPTTRADGLNKWVRRLELSYGGTETKSIQTELDQIRNNWPQEKGVMTTLCPECQEKTVSEESV